MGGEVAGVLIGVPGSAGREVSDMMPGRASSAMAGRGHGRFCKSLIIRWSFSMAASRPLLWVRQGTPGRWRCPGGSLRSSRQAVA